MGIFQKENIVDKRRSFVERNGVIAANNVGGNEWCAICGGPHEAQTGLEVFLKGTGRVICRECTEGTMIGMARDILDEHEEELWTGIRDEPVVSANESVRKYIDERLTKDLKELGSEVDV